VYQWDSEQQEIYFRKGRWEHYLRNLAQENQDHHVEVSRLNGTPIDDSKIFPDLPEE
jgi:hypothetical protein